MPNTSILVLEDEKALRDTLCSHLKDLGYTVHPADTIKKAKLYSKKYTPDLYILDVMLPDGTGLDFCANLRSYSAAPVIFLTCLDDADDIIRGIEKGGDAYLTKPVDYNVLSAHIMAQLRRSGVQSTGFVDLHPLTIDLMKGVVAVEGIEVSLSQKEAQLFAFLATHVERAFTRDEIFKEIWGEGVDTGVVRKYISVLRKKLSTIEECPVEIISTPQGRYLLSRRTLSEW